MRWPLYFVSNKIKNSLHRVSLMSIDGRRRFGAIEFERHDNHEKTIQLYPGTVRVREAFVLRSIEVYPWFNDLVTAFFCFFRLLVRMITESCWRLESGQRLQARIPIQCHNICECVGHIP